MSGNKDKSDQTGTQAHTRQPKPKGGHSMSTKYRGLFIGLAVVAIVAVAFFSFIYSPPREEGLKGAIGTAERYRAEQISPDDVLLVARTPPPPERSPPAPIACR